MSDNNGLELDVVSTLQESFGIFKKMFPMFLLVYLAFLVLLSLITDTFGINNVEVLPSGSFFIFLIFLFALTSFLSGTITAATWSYINGNENPMREGIRRCMEVFIPLYGAVLLTALFVIGGLILLIIPGIIVAIALSIVVPIVVIENHNAVDSLKRSHALTDGHKMSIVKMLLILAIPALFIFAIESNTIIGVFLGPLMQGLLTIFNTILYVVIYKRLVAIEQKT